MYIIVQVNLLCPLPQNFHSPCQGKTYQKNLKYEMMAFVAEKMFWNYFVDSELCTVRTVK